MFKFNFDLDDIDDNSQATGATPEPRAEQPHGSPTTPSSTTAPDAPMAEHPIVDLVRGTAIDTSLLSDVNSNKY